MCAVKRFVVVVVVLAALWAIMPGPADAQSFTAVRPGGRAGTWEFTLPLVYADSARIDGQNGTSVDIDSGYGFGFGFGYNFTDNFQLNGLFNWNSRSYNATYVDPGTGDKRKYNNYMDTSTISLNGVYYILKGDITPFVSGGVGITYVDTNIPTGIGVSYCWYDPWWGYVCSSDVPTKTENDFSYSAGIGVRFDLNRQFSLQGSFNRTWIDISRATGKPEFDAWKLDFIFRM